MRRRRRPSGRAARRSAYVSAAVAIIVTIVTIMILASPGGSERARSCSQTGWPATAGGSPRLVSHGYYVFNNAWGWHLRLKGAAGTSLHGRVTTNARIGLSGASATVRKSLRTSGRAISFSFAGTGAAERIDFRARCATELSFKLGASSAPTGPGPPADLPVFLGVRGRAPTPSFRLQRPALTGVAGRILIGPTCPVVTPNCAPAKAEQGTVRIETAPGSRRGGGQFVKRVKSDKHGVFSTTLPAGSYVLVVEKASGYPVPKPMTVDVEAGVVSEVTLILDTGIR
jgi:hypothetical protein